MKESINALLHRQAALARRIRRAAVTFEGPDEVADALGEAAHAASLAVLRIEQVVEHVDMGAPLPTDVLGARGRCYDGSLIPADFGADYSGLAEVDIPAMRALAFAPREPVILPRTLPEC